MTVVHRHRVRIHEVDAQGHVFHGCYFAIVDDALTEWVRTVTGRGWASLAAQGLDLVVGEVQARFLAPALLDDELQVLVQDAEVGRTSLTVSYLITRPTAEGAEEECVEVRARYVNWDAADGSSRAIGEPFRSCLTLGK
ncbi:thioesterase family protein [Streptomyces sp. SID8352]|uniref:acyl-CoA thioesterase n=1 Tax=Streptomyces sp. SID8352 TaxID=2690338 RepID=UPI001371C400|nr:thioesterase family protein [Streptomyces sp. SID8352]MYU22597.1 acyl-CoA thioesterase [Streptomyces sp. SID8352]